MLNPILIGLVGEHALAVYLERRLGLRLIVDVALRDRGDEGKDLVVAGLVIQVKTRRRDFGETLIRRVDEAGRPRALACDVLVPAFWEDGSEDVRLLGWIWASHASEAGQMKRSPRTGADHWNLVVPDTELLPMSDLCAEIQVRQQAPA